MHRLDQDSIQQFGQEYGMILSHQDQDHSQYSHVLHQVQAILAKRHNNISIHILGAFHHKVKLLSR